MRQDETKTTQNTPERHDRGSRWTGASPCGGEKGETMPTTIQMAMYDDTDI